MKKKNEFKGFTKVLGDTEKKTLLPETKIGESLAVDCELNNDEVGLYIASLDVSASCGFKFEEWENFVRGIIRANENLKEIFKKQKEVLKYYVGFGYFSRLPGSDNLFINQKEYCQLHFKSALFTF